MISKRTIDEIFDTVRIEDVVEDFVDLKRRGSNLLGLCPFHHEKTPSFIVSPAKNIYKCFGCGEAGNAVNFLMNHENISYPEALKWIAGKYSISIQETEPDPETKAEFERKDALQVVNDMALKFFTTQLFDTDEGKSAGLSYFKERGLREETIRKFGLGYAPLKGNLLTVKAKHEGYNLEFLRELGLSNQYGGDFFKGRVMFTIHGLTGKVLGFAGRTLSNRDNSPKYINSPESEIYNKSKILYGFFQARNAIRKLDECLLVEGYMDVLSLAQSGIDNVVAASGTALTVDQVRLIKRFTPNITLLFDGDAAGIKAAMRGLDIVLQQDMNVRVVVLPDGEDPDSFMQQSGPETFSQYLKTHAEDLIRFKTRHLLSEAGGDPLQRVAVAEDLAATIVGIPDPMKQSMYLRETAARLDITEAAFLSTLNKHRRRLLEKEKARYHREQQKSGAGPQKDIPKNQDDPLYKDEPFLSEEYAGSNEVNTDDSAELLRDQHQEKYIAGLLMLFGDAGMEDGVKLGNFLLQNLEDTLELFEHPLYTEIIQMARKHLQETGECPSLSYYTRHSEDAIRLLAIDLSTRMYELSPNWETRYSKMLHQKMPDDNYIKDSLDALNRFKLKKLQNLIRQNQEKMKSAADEHELETMMRMHIQLKGIAVRIAAKTGTVILP